MHQYASVHQNLIPKLRYNLCFPGYVSVVDEWTTLKTGSGSAAVVLSALSNPAIDVMFAADSYVVIASSVFESSSFLASGLSMIKL
jgi:uncharacterized protein involved in response to NO